MYEKSGKLSEGCAVDPESKQRAVEEGAPPQIFAPKRKKHAKWCSFRPQYIYGPHTNKRDYLDWRVDRAASPAVKGGGGGGGSDAERARSLSLSGSSTAPCARLPARRPGRRARSPVCVTHAEDVADQLASVVGAGARARACAPRRRAFRRALTRTPAPRRSAGKESIARNNCFSCGTDKLVTYEDICEAAGDAMGRNVDVQTGPIGEKSSFPFRPTVDDANEVEKQVGAQVGGPEARRARGPQDVVQGRVRRARPRPGRARHVEGPQARAGGT